MTEFLIKISQVRRILSNDTVGYAVCLDIRLILLGYIEHVCPFVRAVLNPCSALSCKSQDRVSVGIYPHALNLILEFREPLVGLAVELVTEPRKKAVPGVDVDRTDLDERHEGDKP